MRQTRVLLVTLGLFASSLMTVPSGARADAMGEVDYSASATGTALYVGALPPDVGGRVGVRVGFSGATVSATSPVGTSFDEFGAKVAVGGAGRHVEARGQGLDVNGLVVAGAAAAGAPPTPSPVTAEVSLVDVPGVASAALARGQAAPVWKEHTCVAGRPMGFGSGRAIGVVTPMAVVDAARSDAITELRPVGDSISVVAEAHSEASTVRLLPGTPEQTTIEVLGETVLRARADGHPRGAALDYAAVGTDPSSPLVRITRGKDVVQLTTQQVFSGGFVLAQTPVMEIFIGERTRGSDTAGGSRPYVGADGVAASGVADLVRVQLVTGGPGEALEVRIGHLEVEVAVPAGGLQCPVTAPSALAQQHADRVEQAWRRRRGRN